MSRLLMERQDSAWGETALSPEGEDQLRADLGRLMVCLTRAVADASVYSTDHHLTVKAVDKFLATFEQLRAYHEELTIVASEDEDPGALALEGVFGDPVPLADCIQTVLAGEYLEQLQGYLTYNDLASLSLRRRVTREELVTLLKNTTRQFTTSQILDREKMAAQRRRQERLSGVLREVQLAGIFPVGREAVLAVERQLPWRVKLALVYITRTLREVQLYATATGTEPRAAATALLRRAVRPLQGPELLVGLLLNCDLVQTRGTQLQGATLQVELLPLLQRPQLVALCRGLLPRPAGDQPDPGHDPDCEPRMALLERVLPALSLVLERESLDIFRTLLEQEAWPLASLPPNVQAALSTTNLADTFLEQAVERVRQISGVQDAAAFCTAASTTPLLVRELLARGELRWALDLARTVHGLASGSPDEGVRQLARYALRSLASGEDLAALVAGFVELDPDQQRHALDLCELLGARAAGALRELERLQLDQRQSWSGRASRWLRGMVRGR